MHERLFFTASNLKRHIQIIHDHKMDQNCDICSKSFPTKGNLMQHIQSAHNSASSGSKWKKKWKFKPFCYRPFLLDLLRHVFLKNLWKIVFLESNIYLICNAKQIVPMKFLIYQKNNSKYKYLNLIKHWNIYITIKAW